MVGRPLPGEDPLLIFVSSVMNKAVEDLQWARDVVVDVVGDTPFLRSWLFEYTPASSEDVTCSYLAKVREADFFVWLVGMHTTGPVRSEVTEALKSQARMLIFKLPVGGRSSETLELLREVGTKAKYAPVRSSESLGSEIEEALSDELIRAVRAHPGPDPLDPWIEVQARRSRLRCIQGWVATGVPYAMAAALADDESVGPSLTRRFGEEEKVRIILGPLGAGKSLAANRLLQSAIVSYKKDIQEPIPIHVSGGVLADHSLEANILAELPTGNTFPAKQGVWVVVDDIAQLRKRRRLELLAEANSLVDQSPRSVITFTGRELPDTDTVWPYSHISLLQESAAIELVNQVSGGSYTRVDLLYRWPQSVRSSIQIPLFAVLLGNYLRGSAGKSPRSSVEMVRTIAERVLSRFNGDEKGIETLLCRLARLCVDQQRDMVAKSEVGDATDIRRLIATGLVRSEGNSVGFSLQLILHWYGFLALRQRVPTAAGITQDRSVLDSWYESLLLLIRAGDYDTASEYMNHIARCDPGCAAAVVHEAIDKWPDDSPPSLPSESECEKRMLSCMTAWVSGIGDLARQIAPVDDRGRVMPIRVKTIQNALRFAWYRGEPTQSGPPGLPKGIFTTGREAMSWYEDTFTQVSPQPAWPWRLTLESLVSGLERLLGAHRLIPESGVGLHEAVWNCALGMLDLGSLRRDPISLDRLRIPRAVPDEAYMSGKLRGLQARHFRMVVEPLVAKGEFELPPPWPTADLRLAGGSGLIVSTYSSEALRSRLEVIFSGAVEMYRELVETWFKPFLPRLGVYSLMPVRLRGVLRHIPEDSQDKSVLFWYMEPITDGGHDVIEILQGDPRAAGGDRELLDRLYSVSAEARPSRGRFASVSTHTTAASRFVHSYPVTNLAYSWLWADLKRLKWVEGMHRDLD